MLSMSVTRNRRADTSEKVHNAAVRRALERKAIREFIKVCTVENDAQDFWAYSG